MNRLGALQLHSSSGRKIDSAARERDIGNVVQTVRSAIMSAVEIPMIDLVAVPSEDSNRPGPGWTPWVPITLSMNPTLSEREEPPKDNTEGIAVPEPTPRDSMDTHNQFDNVPPVNSIDKTVATKPLTASHGKFDPFPTIAGFDIPFQWIPHYRKLYLSTRKVYTTDRPDQGVPSNQCGCENPRCTTNATNTACGYCGRRMRSACIHEGTLGCCRQCFILYYKSTSSSTAPLSPSPVSEPVLGTY